MIKPTATTLYLVLLFMLAGSGLAHGGHHHAAGPASAANTVHVGEAAFLLEPLIDPSGTMKLALTVTHGGEAFGSPLSLYGFTPGGTRFSALADVGATALADVGSFEEGRYTVFAVAGEHHLATSFTTHYGETDLGNEAILVLVPEACAKHPSEAFVYAFEDGESIHRLFLLSQTLEAHEASEPVQLLHTHFREAFNEEGFYPMANQTSLSFTPGLWTIELTIRGGLSETATFAVAVPEH